MTLIKELIDIPEQVQRGDFVLRLSEGVNRPEETGVSHLLHTWWPSHLRALLYKLGNVDG